MEKKKWASVHLFRVNDCRFPMRKMPCMSIINYSETRVRHSRAIGQCVPSRRGAGYGEVSDDDFVKGRTSFSTAKDIACRQNGGE